MEKKNKSRVSHRERGKLETLIFFYQFLIQLLYFVERSREIDSMNKRIVRNIINMKSDISEQVKLPTQNQPGRTRSEMSRIA